MIDVPPMMAGRLTSTFAAAALLLEAGDADDGVVPWPPGLETLPWQT